MVTVSSTSFGIAEDIGHYEDEGKFEEDAFNQFSLTASPCDCLMDAMGCGTHLLSPPHQEAGCFHCLAIVKRVVMNRTEQTSVEWVVKSYSTTVVNPYRRGHR
ncbi:hypothetical protein STEG23_036401 [Scotinomys teguina]